MYFKQKSLFFSFIFLFAFSNVFAASPVTMLETSANSLLTELSKNKAQVKANSNYVNRLVYRYIIPKVDTYGMSRSVLGRDSWRKSSSNQRKLFTRNFVSLVVRTYASALRGYSGEKVVFSPVRGGFQGKRFIKVSSVIVRANGQNIPITYSLINKKGRWKVYDMSVEGVSLLQSYRSQFSQYLRDNSLDSLIVKLKTRRFKSRKV